jgi:hypothetical protein
MALDRPLISPMTTLCRWKSVMNGYTGIDFYAGGHTPIKVKEIDSMPRYTHEIFIPYVPPGNNSLIIEFKYGSLSRPQAVENIVVDSGRTTLLELISAFGDQSR